MAKVLVSLVSDQTIPNVEFIKEFDSEITSYIFISTNQKEEQLQWIKKATKLDETICSTIIVDAFNPSNIENALAEYKFGDEDIIVNITGGTKLMLLIINEYFKKIGAKIYYLTGHNKEYLKVYPGRGKRNLILNSKITLREYLTAYGFEYKETSPYADYQTSNRIFDNYKNLNNDKINEIINPIRLRRGRTMKVENESLNNFLSEVDFKYDKIKLTKEDTKYLSGDWFEEFIYFKIKNEFALNDDEISTGVNLKKRETPNEIDVIFILEHKLYIIECKTSIFDNRIINRMREGKEVPENKKFNLLPEILYKSDALRNNFGLFANTSIFTLEEIKDNEGNPLEIHKNHFERANLSKIIIASKKDLINGISIQKILNIKR